MATINSMIFGSVLVLTTFTILLGCCSATIYKVGDSDGWTTKDDNYYDWADHKEFHVGDSLVFEYDHNFNDVTQVSSALEYEFCETSSPKVVYNTGYDVVTLMEPGYHYFISSNQAQCTSGQKLDILVVHDSKGWRALDEESGDDYYQWSEDKQFHVGDNLPYDYGNELLDSSGDDLEFKLNPATQLLH